MTRKFFEELATLGRAANSLLKLLKPQALNLNDRTPASLLDPPPINEEVNRAWAQLDADVETMRLSRNWSQHDVDLFFAKRLFASRWAATGQNVYTLTHNMAAMFSVTTAPPMDWKHAPHAEFIIKVPRDFLPVDGTIEPDHTYILASEEDTLLLADNEKPPIMQIFYGELLARDRLEPVNVDNLKQQTLAVASELDSETGRDAMRRHLKRHSPGLPEAVLADSLPRLIQHRQERLGQLAQEAGTFDAKKFGQRVLVNRLVGNVLAYVTEHRPASRATGSKLPCPAYETLEPPPEVIVDRAFRDAARAAVAAVLNGSLVGIRRALAHHVRGHWRDQACGPGRSQRKRIWIMPHRRGDESLGSVVRRIEHVHVASNVN